MRDNSRHVGSLERVHWLKTSSAFREIPPADLAVVAQHATERLFRRRSALSVKGEPVSSVRLVVEGRVRVTRDGEPTYITPGETLGVLEVCADDDELEAVAETETLTLSVSGDVFLDLLEDNFAIFHQLLRRICAMRIEQGGDLFADAHAGDVSRYSSIPRARELDLVERIMFLRRCFPFARGRLSALAELSHHVTEVHFEPRAPIWEEGDPSGHLLMVVRGGIACTPPGAREPFRYGPEGATGTLEAVASQPRWFSARAEDGGLQALRLDVEHLLDVFEDNFEMARGYLRYVSQQALGTLRPQAPVSRRFAPRATGT